MAIDHGKVANLVDSWHKEPDWRAIVGLATGCTAEAWRGRAVSGEKQRFSDPGGSVPEGVTSFFVRRL